jgi:CDGSH-type Zn-finger protein
MAMNKEDCKVKIEILKDGPVKITGDFIFRDSSGKTSSEYKELLICRCGGSGNKPFCDGTHKKRGIKN